MTENSNRITLKSLFSEILSVLNFQRGIFYTLREVTLRPRTFITSYLDGDRIRSVNPYRFLFLTTALAAFLSLTFVFENNKFNINARQVEQGGVQFNFESDEELAILQEEVTNSLSKEDEQHVAEFIDRLKDFFNNWLNLIVLMVIPIHAFSCWLFFRKRKWNYAEFLTANCFIFSWANIFFILAVPLLIYDTAMLIWVFRIGALFVLYLMTASMRSRNWFVGVLAGIGASFVTLLLSGALLAGLLELFVIEG